LIGFFGRRRYPNFFAVVVCVKKLVIKIQTEQAEFPHLISDVFARISDGSVRADENFIGVVFVVPVCDSNGITQQPAFLPSVSKRITPQFLHFNSNAFCQKLQMQNFRFARQQIVANRKRSIVAKIHSTLRVAT
jgi:hypothetical protein